MQELSRTTRLFEIDTAKGIAIALVVMGHIVAREYQPHGNDWWPLLHERLYSFHMAFFFYLSGYVFFLTQPKDWPGRLRKSLERLVPAYLLFAALVYVAKLVAAYFLPVDRGVGDLLSEVQLMLLYPTSGFASFLWFIVTLLSLYALMALVAGWMPRLFIPLLACSFGCHLLSVNGNVTEAFALHQLARYWLFFMLGGLSLRHRDSILARFRAQTWAWLSILLVVLIYLPERWQQTVAAMLAIPALHGLSAHAYRMPRLDQMLQWLGRNSYTIFLLNSLALGLGRGLVLKLWSWDDWRFLVVAPALLAFGLLLPVLSQRLLFARLPYLDRITR